ncbi:hypothetical protein GYH30_024304 [Glycine max]|uniref:DNA helicase Pif1-like 2B domain-containing protein n=1 Tax=Glycine max TaxID=3847 RepID=A0A0R0IB14_SOYBN|nr:hypothetical protein GYH30_024304 [Glycine max]
MTLIPSETITYLSFGAPCSVIKNVDTPDVVHIPKFLNRIVASNLLNHKLKLKIEISIMLSRNINQSFAYFFSHDQLYVTMSRVITRKSLKFLVCNNEGQIMNNTSNVVITKRNMI